jgi:hypothetical protein
MILELLMLIENVMLMLLLLLSMMTMMMKKDRIEKSEWSTQKYVYKVSERESENGK